MCAHREVAYPPGDWRCGSDPACPRDGQRCVHLPESERAQDQGLLLPLFGGMSHAEQDVVLAALEAAVAGTIGSQHRAASWRLESGR